MTVNYFEKEIKALTTYDIWGELAEAVLSSDSDTKNNKKKEMIYGQRIDT